MTLLNLELNSLSSIYIHSRVQQPPSREIKFTPKIQYNKSERLFGGDDKVASHSYDRFGRDVTSYSTSQYNKNGFWLRWYSKYLIPHTCSCRRRK